MACPFTNRHIVKCESAICIGKRLEKVYKSGARNTIATFLKHLSYQIIGIVGFEIVQIFVERADARFARLQAVESSPQLIEFVGRGFVPRLSLIR